MRKVPICLCSLVLASALTLPVSADINKAYVENLSPSYNAYSMSGFQVLIPAYYTPKTGDTRSSMAFVDDAAVTALMVGESKIDNPTAQAYLAATDEEKSAVGIAGIQTMFEGVGDYEVGEVEQLTTRGLDTYLTTTEITYQSEPFVLKGAYQVDPGNCNLYGYLMLYPKAIDGDKHTTDFYIMLNEAPSAYVIQPQVQQQAQAPPQQQQQQAPAQSSGEYTFSDLLNDYGTMMNQYADMYNQLENDDIGGALGTLGDMYGTLGNIYGYDY